MTDRLEFRYSTRGQIALFAVGCLLMACSWLVAATSADIVYRVLGWGGVGFFALCAFIAAKRFFLGGTPFVFERAGIAFPSGSFGLLPWTEIKEYAVVTIRSQVFVVMTFY